MVGLYKQGSILQNVWTIVNNKRSILKASVWTTIIYKMSFRSLKDDREHEKENVRSHRKAGKKRSNSAPTIGSDKNVDATDSKGRTALYYAAKYGEIEIVRHLLSNGADPNLHDKMVNYPIHEAVDGGHLDVVELLIRKGMNFYSIKFEIFISHSLFILSA